MNTEALFQRLENSLEVFPLLLQDISDADMRWQPPSGNWSLLEIICHLAHEEASDFRARLRSTLEDATKTWSPIDPEGTVVEQAFNQREVDVSIENFLAERAASLEWLRKVLDAGGIDWSIAYLHPELGPIRAGDLFASWVAHDQLHVRQVAKRICELTVRDAPNYSLAYAGDIQFLKRVS